MSGFFGTDLSAQPELTKFLATLYAGQPPTALLRQAILLRGSRALEVHLVNPSPNHRAEAREILPGIGHSVLEHESVEKYLAHVGS